MKVLLSLSLSLILALLSLGSFADTLSAKVDRTQVSADETLNLVLRYQGQQVNQTPDFSVLSKQFEIISNRKSMQHSIINGQVSASTEWNMVLLAKTTGQLLIPPFSLNGQTSRPITITVNDAAPDPVTGLKDVFVETEVSKTSVYVQEQTLLTFRLFFNRNIDSFDKPDFSIDNARMEELPRVEFQKVISGRTFGVAEFKFAIFPDASGNIHLPEQTWTIRTTDQSSRGLRFGTPSSFKLHRVKTDAVDIEVKPKPAAFPTGSTWLPAQNVTIKQRWSRPISEFKVGEPITRSIEVVAQGVSSEQLPPIVSTENTEDFKFYPDQAVQDNKVESNGISGTRTESLAIVPSRGGELELPAVRLSWWDTQENQLKTAELPAQKVFVKGSAVATVPPVLDGSAGYSAQQTPPTTSTERGTSWYWPFISGLLLIVALGEFWWILALRSNKSQTENGEAPQQIKLKQALKALDLAASSNNPRELKQAAIQLGRCLWPNETIHLGFIARQSGSDILQAEFNNLEARLYSQEPNTTSGNASQLVSELKALAARTSQDNKNSALASLYP